MVVTDQAVGMVSAAAALREPTGCTTAAEALQYHQRTIGCTTAKSVACAPVPGATSPTTYSANKACQVPTWISASGWRCASSPPGALLYSGVGPNRLSSLIMVSESVKQ